MQPLDDTLARRRDRMVASQIANRGVRSPAVLAAMRQVPRERFVPADMAELAYEDMPLPIGEEQTISQPYIVAAMIEAAGVGPQDDVLEVGAGSGYAAAVLSRIASHVCAIERHEALVQAARQRLEQLAYLNVELAVGDGSRGWPAGRSFDAIIVSAAGPDVPEALKLQLAPGGRLVMPVGQSEGQRLVKVTRLGPDRFDYEDLAGVSFVPLIGAYGWA